MCFLSLLGVSVLGGRRLVRLSRQRQALHADSFVAGDVRWGGLETGYADAGAAATLQAYLDAWHAGERLEGSARVAACDVQLTAGDGDFKRVSYVPHGKTRWGWLAAPYCNKNGRAPLW